MLVNREVILAKIESTYGTDPTPVATDGILIENISWSQEGLRMNDRPAVRASIGTLQQVYGGALKTISFDVEIKGSGTAGTPPEADVLLRACGLGVTNVASTSDTYAPVSTAFESITIYYYQDGMRYILTGCRGNVAFNFETGAIGKMSFTMTGHIGTVADIALITPTLDSTVPEPVLSAAVTVGGFAAIVNAFTFDMSNTIATAPDMGASDGYGEVQITKRDVNGSYDPEAELIATEDPHADLIAGTQLAMDLNTVGSTGGNIYNLTMPVLSYRDLSPGDRDGVRTYEIPFGAAESSGDDELSLVFT